MASALRASRSEGDHDLRADHVAGAAFIAWARGHRAERRSADRTLSLPGAGFMPKIVAGLMILFGLALILRARAKARRFAELDWSDGNMPRLVVAITAVAHRALRHGSASSSP